jgi:hypothetical protein
MATKTTETSRNKYAYEHLTPKVFYDEVAFNDDAPEPGDALPSFVLKTREGAHVPSELLAMRRPILLVTGSITCPMTASANPGLKRLHEKYGDRVQFLTLYVREAHPGEDQEQHRSYQEKVQHARALQDRDRLPWRIIVDDIEGSLHRSLDSKPNAAFLTDREGVIVYRSLWAGDEAGLARALDAVSRGRRPQIQESTRRLGPMARGVGVMGETMRKAGPRAGRDMWKTAPPIAATAWVADLYQPLPPVWRTAAAAATFALAAAAVTVGVRRIVDMASSNEYARAPGRNRAHENR